MAPGLDVLSFQFRTYYFIWIAAAHSLQYLWVTAYYARQAGNWRGQLPNYLRVFAAGAAAWTLPAVVFCWMIQLSPSSIAVRLAAALGAPSSTSRGRPSRSRRLRSTGDSRSSARQPDGAGEAVGQAEGRGRDGSRQFPPIPPATPLPAQRSRGHRRRQRTPFLLRRPCHIGATAVKGRVTSCGRLSRCTRTVRRDR